MAIKRFGGRFAITLLVLFLFIVTFIYTNFPELRNVALIVFFIGVASYFFQTKPKRLRKEVKLLVFFMLAAQAFNVYLMFTVPDYFRQGMVYVVLAVMTLVLLFRKEQNE